ncbi:MAG: 2,3-bisphosphoglycerate-dependent phosphoglycerate mutase [Bdellovibrio bacteriovorus]
MATGRAPVLVLIRHGHSEWNLSNRLTGWTDILLNRVGLDEAAAAGRRLAAAGYGLDEVHCSLLRRTQQTAESLLDALGMPEVPIERNWRLNERHYGQLQGMTRPEILARWGEERARRWWRGYFDRPPELDADDPRHPRFSPLYRHLDPALLPAAESLRDCQVRTLPYWQEVLAPRIADGRRLLVVSHGNTLRGLVMHLDQITPEAMERVEIPSGVPLVYRFAPDLTPLGRDWLA